MEEIKTLVDKSFDEFNRGRLSRAVLRDLIAQLEEKVQEQEQLPIETRHYFSKAVYAREIFVPRGTLVIGKIHKHQNLNIISKGSVTFFSIDGIPFAEAPFTFVASPGVKRVIYAHTDIIWTTVHGTHEIDLSKIEDEFIAKDYSDLDTEDVCLG